MSTKFFTEAVAEAPVKRSAGKYLVAIATPGQGSSGYYSEDMLKEYGPVAFPRGAKSFINHDAKRDMRDCIGTFKEGAYWDDDRKQVMGELSVFEHWTSFVEAVYADSGMSIYMAGESDKDNNVTKLIENVQNGADLVAYPGLAGSGFVEMLESARAGSDKPPTASVEDHEDGKDATRMEEKLDKLIELMTAFAATKTAEAQETAQVTADETLAQERIDAFESSVEAIDAADLTPAQKKALRVEAKAGSDVTKLIEAQVALKAEILQESGAQLVEGRVVTSGSASFSTPWKA